MSPWPGTAQQLQSLTTYGTGAFCWYYLASLATDPKVILLYLKLKYAVASLAMEAIAVPVQQGSQLETLVAAQAREPDGGLIVMPDVFL
jgi:hypothetical protein